MEINGNQRPVDPAARKPASQISTPPQTTPKPPVTPEQGGQVDAFQSPSPSSEEVQRYVDILKQFSPVDSAKVETVRQDIADDDYPVSPGDLVEKLSFLLGAGGPAE